MSFFKKINNSLNKVSETSVNFGSTLQLKSELKTLNTNVDAIFSKIGRLYFSLNADNHIEDTDLSNYFIQVKQLYAEIKQIENKILALSPKKTMCSDCGLELADNTRFCGTCGGKAVEVVKAKSITSNCTNCGGKTDHDVSFCPHCGYNLSK